MLSVKDQYSSAGPSRVDSTSSGKSCKKSGKNKMFDEEVDKYGTYEEYLDSLVSEEDHKYLEDEDMARTIAELGYRSSGDTLSREGFYKLKNYLAATRNLISQKNMSVSQKGPIDKTSKSSDQSLVPRVEKLFTTNNPLVGALRDRAPQIQNGGIRSIIFMRTHILKKNKRGTRESYMEISGHIDLAQRQFSENWIPYLSGEKRLLPRKVDSLTFYNWNRGIATFNSTDNFEVIMPSSSHSNISVKHRETEKCINITETDLLHGWITIKSDEEDTIISIYDLNLN